MSEASKTGSDGFPTRADELLEALKYARKAYVNGETCSLTWVRERRMIVKEAEMLGISGEILSRMNEA